MKGLVELHGGSVRARSEGPGRGSEFVVSLPLVARRRRRPEPARPVRGPAGRASSSSSRTTWTPRDTLAEILAVQGHEVHVAHDGRAGLAPPRAAPDVILCDIGLPDMDGYDVARALRADEASRSTRLVALSGYAQPEDRQRARDAGFDAHVAKPPRIEELANTVAGNRRAGAPESGPTT